MLRTRNLRNFESIEVASGFAANIADNLAATLETFEKIQEQQKLIHDGLKSNGVDRASLELGQEYMDFQLQVIHELVRRSNYFQNQLKARATRLFNVLVRADSSDMKSISILTMVFLPATFISTLFSTPFFSDNDHRWKASKDIWVYWAVTIPVTLAVFAAWHWVPSMWLRIKKRQRRWEIMKEELEDEKLHRIRGV
ncbi:hypothetical protein FQN51_007646 [Onygenales sp. PD_10]|nr:hypothetical protein FQN51_007646 [Onygenales sp. PD_10]